MPRHPARVLIPVLAFVALVVLSPTRASALPWVDTSLSAAERREAAPGFLSRVWDLLSVVWAENGPGLDPNGAKAFVPEPEAGATGDNGPGLEPNG